METTSARSACMLLDVLVYRVASFASVDEVMLVSSCSNGKACAALQLCNAGILVCTRLFAYLFASIQMFDSLVIQLFICQSSH